MLWAARAACHRVLAHRRLRSVHTSSATLFGYQLMQLISLRMWLDLAVNTSIGGTCILRMMQWPTSMYRSRWQLDRTVARMQGITTLMTTGMVPYAAALSAMSTLYNQHTTNVTWNVAFQGSTNIQCIHGAWEEMGDERQQGF